MELRQLQYFQEVCRCGSFTKAASTLYVAQPVITNAVRKLEDELNVRLLHRTSKNVSLTDEGRVFWQRINALLEMTADIVQEMKDFDPLCGGTLRLGIPPQIGNYFFPRVFIEFSSLFPDLNLVVTEDTSLKILSLVQKGELDIAIVVLPEEIPPQIQTRRLFQQRILLCVGKNHPLSRKKTVQLSDLRGEKFIMRKPGSIQRDVIIERCRQLGFSPNVIFSSSQIQTIRTLVASNVGISFLMEMTVQNDHEIQAIELTDPVLLTIGAVWKKEKYISKAAQAFIDFVSAMCSERK